ncbi:MAG: MBL fold metallo-hydrolase [Verrucomicrobiales bacterium]
MLVHTIDLKFEGRGGAIGAFLVEGPGGHVLIESGPESTFEALVSGLGEHGVGAGDLAGLFVTHVHLDHAGAAGKLAAEGVPVFVHPKGARHLLDPERLVGSAKQVYGDRFERLWGGMAPVPEGLLTVVGDAEIVSVAGLEIEAVDTPGHAFHHHAYAVGDVCFAGDAAGVAVGPSGFISVASAPPSFHLEHTLASIDKLARRGFHELFLTHFGEVSDVGSHLSSYRDAVELNATFVKQRLQEGMDAESLRVAYQAFNLEQAFRHECSRNDWEILEAVNGAEMCADGIRLFWEKRAEGET